jgi:hypothetical protein
MESNGLNVPLGADDFGYRFTGSNLESRSVSARREGRSLILRIPHDVEVELALLTRSPDELLASEPPSPPPYTGFTRTPWGPRDDVPF